MSREAFENWHLKTFGYEPTSEQTHNANKYFQDPVWMAWLESEVEQSKAIAELQAQNAELVWALKHVKPATRNIDANAWDVIEKALAKKGE